MSKLGSEYTLDEQDRWQLLQTDPFTLHHHPRDGEHDLTGRTTCWCKPLLEQRCPVCLCLPDKQPTCDYCEKSGFVDAFTDDPEWTTIVSHEDVKRFMLN